VIHLKVELVFEIIARGEPRGLALQDLVRPISGEAHFDVDLNLARR
jgi:hypothetical protein